MLRDRFRVVHDHRLGDAPAPGDVPSFSQSDQRHPPHGRGVRVLGVTVPSLIAFVPGTLAPMA
jgi:hypothetical protein